MNERRRHSRVALEAPVSFVAAGDPAVFRGTARDISLGGIFFQARHVLPLGTELVVTILLPDQVEEISLPGVVRWQRPDGMGVEFALLGERETRALGDFVDSASS